MEQLQKIAANTQKIWQVYSGGRRIGQACATETALRAMFPGEWLELDARRGTATVFGRA